MSYLFDNILLSAVKTGNPPITTAITTAHDVTMISLSTNDKGLAFNLVTRDLRTTTLVNSILSSLATPSLSFSTLTSLGFSALSVLVLPVSATNVNVLGSVFKIDTSYNNTVMALVEVPVNNIATYTVFTHLSAVTTVPLSAVITGVTDVTDPEVRRKYLLGYV